MGNDGQGITGTRQHFIRRDEANQRTWCGILEPPRPATAPRIQPVAALRGGDQEGISCEQSGNPPDYHFAGAGKMIGIGSGAIQIDDDYFLSLFACYLIAPSDLSRARE